MLHTLNVPGLSFGTLQFSPDSRLLLATFEGCAVVRYQDGQECMHTDGVVRLWDVATGKEVRVLKGHTDRVVTAAFSPDGRRILTASWDRTARIWDAATGKELFALRDPHFSVASAAFSKAGARVILVSAKSHNDSSRVRLDGKKPPAVIDPPARPGVGVVAIYTAGFGARLGGGVKTAGKEYGPVRLFDADTGGQVAVLGRADEPAVRTTLGPDGPVVSIETQGGVNGQEVDPTVDEGQCAAFSPDGERVAVGCWGGTVKFWDARTGGLLTSWKGKRDNLYSIAYSPDGHRLLLGYGPGPEKGGGVCVCSASDGKELANWPFERPGSRLANWIVEGEGSRSAAFSPDGKQVLLFPAREYVMKTNTHPQLRGADGKLVLTVTQDRLAVLADAAGGKESAVLRGHERDITGACFSPDGGQVLTASLDGTARLWDAGPAPEYALTLRGHNSPVSLARFSPDGRRLFTAFGPRGEVTSPSPRVGGVQEVRVWDVTSGKTLAVLKGLGSVEDAKRRDHLLGSVHALDVSPDGEHLVTVSLDYRARKEKGADAGLPFTPVRVWNVRTGKEQFALPGFTSGARSASFSPDGKRLLVVSDHTQRFRVLNDKGQFNMEAGATGVLGRHSAVSIWDAGSGELIRKLLGEKDQCNSAAWSPDGGRIVTAGYNRVQMWDAATGKELFRFEPEIGTVEGVAFSPDGRYVLGLRRDSADFAAVVPLWDARTGKLRALLGGHADAVTAAAFSPRGDWLVTTSRDGTARLWRPATGSERFVLRGHEGVVQGAAFSPDGKRVVTVSEDLTARIWDVETGRAWLTLAGHAGPVYSAVFSPDGQRVATTSGDGTARIWPVDPLPLARRACRATCRRQNGSGLALGRAPSLPPCRGSATRWSGLEAWPITSCARWRTGRPTCRPGRVLPSSAWPPGTTPVIAGSAEGLSKHSCAAATRTRSIVWFGSVPWAPRR